MKFRLYWAHGETEDIDATSWERALHYASAHMKSPHIPRKLRMISRID